MSLETEIDRVKAKIIVESAKENKNISLIANMESAVAFAELQLEENIDTNELIIAETTLNLY